MANSDYLPGLYTRFPEALKVAFDRITADRSISGQQFFDRFLRGLERFAAGHFQDKYHFLGKAPDLKAENIILFYQLAGLYERPEERDPAVIRSAEQIVLLGFQHPHALSPLLGSTGLGDILEVVPALSSPQILISWLGDPAKHKFIAALLPIGRAAAEFKNALAGGDIYKLAHLIAAAARPGNHLVLGSFPERQIEQADPIALFSRLLPGRQEEAIRLLCDLAVELLFDPGLAIMDRDGALIYVREKLLVSLAAAPSPTVDLYLDTYRSAGATGKIDQAGRLKAAMLADLLAETPAAAPLLLNAYAELATPWQRFTGWLAMMMRSSSRAAALASLLPLIQSHTKTAAGRAALLNQAYDELTAPEIYSRPIRLQRAAFSLPGGLAKQLVRRALSGPAGEDLSGTIKAVVELNRFHRVSGRRAREVIFTAIKVRQIRELKERGAHAEANNVFDELLLTGRYFHPWLIEPVDELAPVLIDSSENGPV